MKIYFITPFCFLLGRLVCPYPWMCLTVSIHKPCIFVDVKKCGALLFVRRSIPFFFPQQNDKLLDIKPLRSVNMSAWLICEPLLTFGGSRGLSCPEIYWLGHSLKCIHWHLFMLSWPSSLVWRWRLFLYLCHVQKGKLKLSPTYHCHWLQDQKKKLCFRHRAQWNDLVSYH